MEIIGTDKRSKLVYILQKIRCAPFFFLRWHNIGRFPFQGTTCCAGHGFAAHPGFPGGAAPLPPHQDLSPPGGETQLSRYTRPKCRKKPAAGDPTAGGLDSILPFISWWFSAASCWFSPGGMWYSGEPTVWGVDWERSWSRWLEQENRVQYLRRAHEEQVAGICSKDQS